MDLKPRNGATMKEMQEFEQVGRWPEDGIGGDVVDAENYDALLAYTKELAGKSAEYKSALYTISDLHKRAVSVADHYKAELARASEGGWISVEQELPAIGRTVIVQGGIAYRVTEEWISQTGAASGRAIMWPVTHWMPIPELPSPPLSVETPEVSK